MIYIIERGKIKMNYSSNKFKVTALTEQNKHAIDITNDLVKIEQPQPLICYVFE